MKISLLYVAVHLDGHLLFSMNTNANIEPEQRQLIGSLIVRHGNNEAEFVKAAALSSSICFQSFRFNSFANITIIYSQRIQIRNVAVVLKINKD